MQLDFRPYTLIFKEDAGTSRGVLKVKPTCFLKCWDETTPELAGYGEAAWFPGLSPESEKDFYYELNKLKKDFSLEKANRYSGASSIKFGLEQCILDLANGSRSIYFPSKFTEGQSEIVINGLIWMGSKNQMIRRLEEKIEAGFCCIKIKIGAIDWEDELDLIGLIRKMTGENVEIRVDANGAFSPGDCLEKLRQLANLNVHSIEQPIRAGLNSELKKICHNPPLPIALDESLIGIKDQEAKRKLLEYVSPQYIILKPSLCGGFGGTLEWIQIAEELNIGWWITSALESSVGLDAISQFAGKLNVEIPQGLGTGALYLNNLPSPLCLEADKLKFIGPAGNYRVALEEIFRHNG